MKNVKTANVSKLVKEIQTVLLTTPVWNGVVFPALKTVVTMTTNVMMDTLVVLTTGDSMIAKTLVKM